MSERKVERDAVLAINSRTVFALPAKRQKEGRAWCRICLGEHDDLIHAATVRVRLWHRAEIQKCLDRPSLSLTTVRSRNGRRSRDQGEPADYTNWLDSGCDVGLNSDQEQGSNCDGTRRYSTP
jgi:hypothetical protein